MCRIVLLLVFVLVKSAWSQDISSFSFDTVLEIGSDEQADENYLLGRVTGIAVDSSKRIIVADEMSMRITLYDAEGNYVKSLGDRGSGPGEFQAITSMTLNKDQHLVVMDGRLSRVTILTLDGQVIKTSPINRSEMIWPRALSQHERTGDYYVVSKMPEHPARSRADVDHFIHVYDVNFGEKKGRIASYEEIETYKDDEFALVRLHTYPGSMSFSSDGELLFALGLYNGHIYKYANRAGSWTLAEQYRGFMAPVDIYERVDPESTKKRGFALTKRVVGKEVVTVAGYTNILSAGLFSSSNGGIVHFVNVNEEERGTLYMETYDSAGKLNSVRKLHQDLPRSGGRDPSIKVYWRDANEHYYIVDSSQDYPILKVVKVR